MSEWLRDLAAKATPGPWTPDFPGMIVAAPSGVVLEAEPWDYTLDNEADYRLIALAPDLARVAADLADAARWERQCRDDIALGKSVSGLAEAKAGVDAALATFDALAPKAEFTKDDAEKVAAEIDALAPKDAA